MHDVEAIVVPGGGGQRGATADTLPPWMLRRLDRAADLYYECGSSPLIVTLSAGTPHRANYVTEAGWPVLESTSAATYLHEHRGVPYSDIIRETTSLDTIGNAYFFRTGIADPLGLRNFVVVTSALHMPRTQAIFDWMFQIMRPAPQHRITLRYDTVADEGLDDALITARQEREVASLRAFEEGVKLQIPLTDMWFIGHVARWLFTQHRAYACHDQMIPTVDLRTLPKEVLDTY
jgi:hypothetical protein